MTVETKVAATAYQRWCESEDGPIPENSSQLNVLLQSWFSKVS